MRFRTLIIALQAFSCDVSRVHVPLPPDFFVVPILPKINSFIKEKNRHLLNAAVQKESTYLSVVTVFGTVVETRSPL